MTAKTGYVTVEALAKHFSVSISTIRAWLRQGYIPADTYIKIGTTYRFSPDKVEAALVSKTQEDLAAEDQDEEVVTQTSEDQMEFPFDADQDPTVDEDY